MTIIDSIKKYHANGWVTVPVKAKSKQPIPHEWQKHTLADVNIDTDFPEGVNVGVLLGDNSGGLVDIDIDCPEALKIAARHLPETGAIFGRPGNPKSHRLYKVEGCGDGRKYTYDGTLLEYRANGEQTVFPPSIHPSGEQYAFEVEGEPATVAKADLEQAVIRIAAACLMARCWHDGQRHDTALALAGSLLRAGWHIDEVAYFIESVCIAAGDREIEDRLAGIRTTAAAIQGGEPTTGLPTLADLIGDTASRRLAAWLGIGRVIAPVRADTVTQHSGEQFTDSRLSDVFARDYQGIARFCHEAGYWFVWDGKHWAPDICDKVIMLVEECVKQQISAYAKTVGADELKKTIAFLSTGKFRSVADLAKAKMPVTKAEFNADKWLFNCTNGVLDIRTGKLLKHEPRYYQSFLANVAFEPEADCPKFKKFIRQIMLDNEPMMAYLQRAAGYTLTGDTSEQCFFLLMGDGKNGKSTLLELMRHIFGNYARTVAAKTLMVSKGDQIPSDIALLEGKRFAPCSETSNVQKLNEARIKTLTGGDEVEARRRYADEYNYMPQFKLWVATNSLPQIKGTDEGIWRRIHKIPFDMKLPEGGGDKYLKDKLEAEASGILNWLLAGVSQWQELGGLQPPEEVKRATQAYRDEMDNVRDFIADCLQKTPGSFILNQKMYVAFRDWHLNNVGEHVPSQKELTQRLRQAGFEQKAGKNRRWVDVDLARDISDEEMLGWLAAPVAATQVATPTSELPF